MTKYIYYRYETKYHCCCGYQCLDIGWRLSLLSLPMYILWQNIFFLLPIYIMRLNIMVTNIHVVTKYHWWDIIVAMVTNETNKSDKQTMCRLDHHSFTTDSHTGGHKSWFRSINPRSTNETSAHSYCYVHPWHSEDGPRGGNVSELQKSDI